MPDPIDIRIAEFEDALVIHFGSASPRINAYTLASALIGLADAAKAANASLNPGHEIEIVVEALSPGSFKATLRALYGRAGNLFSGGDVRAIVLGIIAAFIYEHTLGSSPNVTVNVTTDEVIIVQGKTKVVVPRQLHEETKRLSNNPGVLKGVGTAIRAVESDPQITSIGLSPNPDDSTPPVELTREMLAMFSRELVDPVENTRDLEEITDLQILRAILERSRRRWEFAWNGIRIAAPISDDRFYDDFFRHRIRIATGDILRVRLRVRQSRNADLGVFINTSYEVIEVIEHKPRAQQLQLAKD